MQGRMVCASWKKAQIDTFQFLRFKDITLMIFNSVFPLYSSPFNNLIRIMKPNRNEIFYKTFVSNIAYQVLVHFSGNNWNYSELQRKTSICFHDNNQRSKEDVSNYFILWFLLYSNNYQIPLNNYTYDFHIDSIVSTHCFVSSSRRNLRHFRQKQGQQKKQ